MNKRFDDMIRRRLQGHESEVPHGLFDTMAQRPDVQDAFFDTTIRSKMNATESAVATHLFDTISGAAELEYLSFDLTIRSKTENAVSAVPAGMWQRIIVQKDRRRRPVAWWWMAATLALLLAGGGTFYFFKNNPALHPVAATSSHTVPTVISRNSPTPTNKILPGKEDGIATGQPAHTPTAKGFEESNGKPGTTAIQPLRSAHPITSGEPNLEILSGKSGKLSLTPAGNLETTVSAENTDDPALASSETTNRAALHLTALSLLRNIQQFTPGQLLRVRPLTPIIPCPAGSDDRRSDWYVDVYSSAFLLRKEVQDQYLGKNAKAGFDSTLHRQISFNAGISLVKSLGEKFLLKTGLQYNRINENFSLTRVNERRLITTISVRTVVIAPGDTVRIRDTSTTEQIGTAQYRTQNRYSQWDVPVIIGYAFGSENLRLNANAGIIANIRSSYQGEMLADSTRKIIDINHYNSQPIYRKSVGFSLYAGLSIVKPLSGKTSLIIEPYTRIGLSNVTNSQAWFNQKNSMMGLSIGLRYKLNGGRQRIY